MIRSIALSLVMATSLFGGVAPAFSEGDQGGEFSCELNSAYCAPRGRPGVAGPDIAAPGGDPGYYRPDDRRPRPPHRPPFFPVPPPDYYRPLPPPPYYETARVSCREARNILRSEGFRRVEAVDCEGSRYQFEAVYRGRPVLVTVSSRSGRILGVERI